MHDQNFKNLILLPFPSGEVGVGGYNTQVISCTFLSFKSSGCFNQKAVLFLKQWAFTAQVINLNSVKRED